MARFKDLYMNTRVVGYPVRVSPMFSTDIVSTDSGSEQANQHWANPLRNIVIPEGVRDHATFEALKAHWLIMAGPFSTFPFRDPTDFASVDLTKVNTVPTTSRTDQALGTGDGTTRVFQLSKRYTASGQVYDRTINFPVVSSIEIGVDGADPASFSPALTFTVAREGGTVTFDTAPDANTVLTWGGLFDLQVRFESDDTFDGIMRTYGVSGFADVPLREVRYCP